MILVRITFIFLSIITSAIALAEPVTIRGSVQGASGLKIELIVYSDFITNTEMPLAETNIGQAGMFEIRADLKTTTIAILKIGIQKGEIILEPGKTYNLKISGLLDRSLRNKEIAPFQIPALQIEIVSPWRFELNSLVNDFYIFHDGFMAEHAHTILRQRDGRLVQQYVTEIYNRFPGINNAWFNDLLRFNIASLELMARAKGRDAIADTYLLNQEILYSHMAYMDFFNDYFAKYLTASRLFDRNQLLKAFESPDAYKSMMNVLDKDKLLHDRQLRELVLLKNIPDLLANPGYSKHSILSLLETIRTKSAYPEHRLIAGNLAVLLSRN
ncbi:MAG: hypothetical protein IH597_09755 [Bacteroidales bacterium]|nr:hypothetical protein [Bacteroidales bacterium]